MSSHETPRIDIDIATELAETGLILGVGFVIDAVAAARSAMAHAWLVARTNLDVWRGRQGLPSAAAPELTPERHV